MNTILDFFKKLFDSADFMPRWVCGNWTEMHGWLYILSNLAIWAAYFTIPFLLYFFLQKRKIFIFKPVIVWFSLFILFCGITHLLDATAFWIPNYRLSAVFLFITAIVSWISVYVLYKYLPKALEYKSPEQLQLIIDEQTKELTAAYHKLAESESQFKTLVNSNPDVITRIGKDLKYKFINDAILRMRKLKLEDIVGSTVEEIGNKDGSGSNNLFISSLKKAFETGENQSFEFNTHTNSSSQSYFQLNIIPLRDIETNQFDDVLTVTKDITSLKVNELALSQNVADLEMLAKKLENKRRILEDFTYIVSHNLRSPVSNLASLLHLIEGETNPEIKEVLLHKITGAFNKLSTTVSDLTSVVTIRQNTEIQKEFLKFEGVLQSHLTNLETQIKEADAEIEYDFSKCDSIDYPKIYLESIFLNLLTNALKYRSPERKLKIIFTSSIDKDGLISLICEDNGLGIDLSKHGNKIFGLNKTFHQHKDSKGVGLFITKNQIETMGGSIYVESKINIGSKFFINFNNYILQWTEK